VSELTTRLRFVAFVALCFALCGCLSLPSEQWVAHRYEFEHPGAKVISVTKIIENESDYLKARARFHIDYNVSSDRKIHHDTWTYGHVAEGWLRRGVND
jgi:hypothetical protein